MNIELELKTTAYTTGQIPSLDLPQVALAGRSNVGKSSLINALAGGKKLAKVSANPGKTRSINFYLVKPWDFYLVDLPGYGYARAGHEERRKWAAALEAYIGGSRELRSLALLLDCRVPPQKLDVELARFAMTMNLPLLPVLTKVDKCNARERSLREREWREILGVVPLAVSAHKRSGLDKLWRRLIVAATGKNPDDVIPEPVNY